jgi:hypothetical protein
MQSHERLAELQTAIEGFGEAWAKGDGSTLDAMLSPTYTHTDIFGALLERADWLAYATGRAGRSNRIAFRDVQTRIIDDFAIVTGINEVEGQGARSAEDRAALALRFTQVWRLKNGKWLREAFQATPISTAVAS